MGGGACVGRGQGGRKQCGMQRGNVVKRQGDRTIEKQAGRLARGRMAGKVGKQVHALQKGGTDAQVGR